MLYKMAEVFDADEALKETVLYLSLANGLRDIKRVLHSFDGLVSPDVFRTKLANLIFTQK